jgi:crossover junction endodeoxyribonuclease RuvC
LTATGIASSTGWWTTIGVDDLTTHPLPRRHGELWALGHQILDTIGRPDLVVIEAPAYSRSGAGTSERCGLWWRIVHALTDRGIPVAEVMATTRIRYALGKGVGRKTAIVDTVARRWPQYATGGDDNACDAVVLMAMGMDALGHPVADMPKANRAALDAVRWPEVASCG